MQVLLQLVLDGNGVSMLGRVQTQENLALAIVQGSGAGGVFTFNAPNCAIDPITPPSTANDISIIDMSLRLRDGAATTGNDSWSITLT